MSVRRRNSNHSLTWEAASIVSGPPAHRQTPNHTHTNMSTSVGSSSIASSTRSRKVVSPPTHLLQTSYNTTLPLYTMQSSPVSSPKMPVKSLSEKRLLHEFAWDPKAATLCARIVATHQQGYRGICFLRQGAHQLIVGDLHLQKGSMEQHQLIAQRRKSTTICSSNASSSDVWEYVELLSFYNYFQEREEFRMLAKNNNFPSNVTSGFMAELLQCTLQFLCGTKVITGETTVYLKASGVALSKYTAKQSMTTTTATTTTITATYIPLVAFYTKLGFRERFSGLIERYGAWYHTQAYSTDPNGVKKQWELQQKIDMHGLNREALGIFYNTKYVNLSGVEMHASVQNITDAWSNRPCRFVSVMLKPLLICKELNDCAYEVNAL